MDPRSFALEVSMPACQALRPSMCVTVGVDVGVGRPLDICVDMVDKCANSSSLAYINAVVFPQVPSIPSLAVSFALLHH